MSEDTRTIQHGIAAAFRIAHLLTADSGRAESATLQGIESWDPAEPYAALFTKVLTAATRASEWSAPALSPSSSTCSYLPVEMQRVVMLPRTLRHSFVLRILAGLPADDCARMLHLCPGEVEVYVCAALQHLQAQETRS